MNPGQWRVLVLILVLLFLESLRSTNVSGFLSAVFVKPLTQSGG